MSTVQRICGQCQRPNPLDTRYCNHCGADTLQPGDAAQNNSNLPMLVGRAALPVLVGAAGLAVRAGWRLAKSQMVRDLAKQAIQAATTHITSGNPPSSSLSPSVEPKAPVAKQTADKPVHPASQQSNRFGPRIRQKIHVRSSWRVSDGQGGWQQGESEHTIEIDE